VIPSFEEIAVTPAASDALGALRAATAQVEGPMKRARLDEMAELAR
jgi:hypothetical protein